MGADYRNYKTPYYEISVSNSSGSRAVKLPHHILRLVEKIEITETFTPGQFTTFNIDFIEGSREPGSPNARLGTKGLYKVTTDGQNSDMDIAGSITNRSGAITDLRFSGSSGITWLTSEEKVKGKVDDTVQENINGELITRKWKKEPAPPLFLFQERNRVTVTWGYLEDPNSRRTISGYIFMLSSSFPESGQIKTTITCQDTRAALDQIATTKGVPFGVKETSEKGNSIVTFRDNTTSTTIRNICDKAGMAHIVSENLPADKVDKNRQKLWIGGESFHQFMTRLADIHHSYYSVITGKSGEKDTLVFIKKQDFESKLVITDKELTTFKGPNSILKSVDIKCDFGVPTGNTQKSINEDGKEQGVTNNKIDSVQFKDKDGKVQQGIPNRPVDEGNEIPAAKSIQDNIADGETTGTVDNNPSNSKQRQDDIAQAKANDSARNIILEFTSLGYTGYSPGVIEFLGLGVRYSGKYRLQTAVHTIDNSGYVTKGTALSMSISTGGVSLPGVPKAEDPIETRDVILFKKEGSPTPNKESIMDTYHKTINLPKSK